MFCVWFYSLQSHVALLAEGVDRNVLHDADADALDVALLAEGVDRNSRLLQTANRV